MTPLPRDEAREERGERRLFYALVNLPSKINAVVEVENRLIETYMKHQQHYDPNGTR